MKKCGNCKHWSLFLDAFLHGPEPSTGRCDFYTNLRMQGVGDDASIEEIQCRVFEVADTQVCDHWEAK